MNKENFISELLFLLFVHSPNNNNFELARPSGNN